MVKISVTVLLFWGAVFSHSSGDKPMQSPEESVKETMRKVAEWQMTEFSYIEEGNLHDYGIDAWTNGVLYLGMQEWTQIAGDSSRYWDWLMDIGRKNEWAIPANFAKYPQYQYYHADELCVGQFYLYMYDRYREGKMLESVKERADWIMNHPADTNMNYRNKQSWTWCDALFMAPPVYVHLSKITGEKKYVAFMHENFLRTYNHLYSPENALFFRDDSYLNRQEANGEPVFWGRGNGWVLAGVVNLLKLLPDDSEWKSFYENLFVALATRLGELQDENGFWHASLLDPESYPAPETSATALITYGLAYGLNQGLLADSYRPLVEKAWQALASVINEDGKPGFVQPIGADPKKVTREMTAVYGTGALLMAGTEIVKLLNSHPLKSYEEKM